jgi:hypothetical protein
MTPRTLAFAALIALGGVAVSSAPQSSTVAIRHEAAKQEYVVTIGGKPFTTYAYGDVHYHKPIFYPVISPNGARVNREYPMVQKVAGETADHPHHMSLFFTHDEVNGINFWGVSTGKGQRIQQRAARVDGSTLTADLLWKDAEGQTIFEETRRVTFGGASDISWMDHEITLRAPRVAVSIGDTKEGSFGLRLHDTLKETKGGTGRYINAEGAETEANVWGKKSPWVAIRGTVTDSAGPKDVTVAIMAHPSGHNSPPFWHARAYGLFAVNPFGQRAFDQSKPPTAPERITRVAVGEQIRMKFRVAVYSGKVEKTRLDGDFTAFRK